jgi:hypothetical protein
MGINAKPDNDSPIGFFGTGMKIALAILLRENATVAIKTPNGNYEFGVVTKNFRDKTFDVITCNDLELGFTTELGKQWGLEGAYRELVSNTMDESGEWGRYPITEKDSTIYVTNKKFAECFDNHENIFVGSRVPIASSDKLNIYKGDGKIFYRGVKVGFIEEAMYSYELLDEVKLTEDRTIFNIYDVYRSIERGIEKLTDKSILKLLFTAKKPNWEADRGYYGVWGVAMKEVVAEIWEESPTKLINNLQHQIRSQLPDAEFNQIEIPERHERMLAKAKEFLVKMGYDIKAKIKYISNEDNLNIAFVHSEIIHLTERSFDQGLFFLITTLLEEHCHTIGYSDESRRFEQFLMNELVKAWSIHLEIDL